MNKRSITFLGVVIYLILGAFYMFSILTERGWDELFKYGYIIGCIRTIAVIIIWPIFWLS